MTLFPRPNSAKRAPRAELRAPIAAVITKEKGDTINGELQTFSMTGGRICIPARFAEDDLVEITFSTACGVVQGLAGMLKPGKAKNGLVVQPFRFVAVDDQYCNNLREAIESSGN